MRNCGILAAVLLAAAAPAAAAQGEDAYDEALKFFYQYAGSEDASQRAAAVQTLVQSTYPRKEMETVKLILALLDQELVREGGKAQKEEDVSGVVLQACEAAFGSFTDEKVIRHLLKVAGKRTEDTRKRFYIVAGLGASGSEEVHKQLVVMAEDSDPMIQIAATDALLTEGRTDSLGAFLKAVGDPQRTWEAKLIALDGILKTGARKDPQVIEPLIEALGRLRDDEGRVQVRIMGVLNELMGTDLKSNDPKEWRDAWKSVQEGKPPADGATVVEPTVFFGLETRSTRIVFILDRTRSMEGPLEPAEPEKRPPPGDDVATGGSKDMSKNDRALKEEAGNIRKKYDTREVKTRMDACKKEFINTVYNLDPRVQFTVIWYEATSTAWKEYLVPATWENKYDAIAHADKLTPQGGTNIWEALEHGYRLIGNPKMPGKVERMPTGGNYTRGVSGADTFFLLTDGEHTVGKFDTNPASGTEGCKHEEFTAELRKVHRVRKIVVNTICLGSRPFPLPENPIIVSRPDTRLMQAIAAETGGQFTHIKDK